MRQFRFVLLVLLSVVLAACAQHAQAPRDEDSNSRPTEPAMSVSSQNPEVGDEFDITFVVLSDLDYAVVDVLVCDSGETLEHWVYDRSRQLNPSREITRSITYDEEECLRVIYTTVRDGDDLPGTPINTEINVGGDADDDDGNDDGNDDRSEACEVVRWFNITLTNGDHVEDGDRVDTDDGFGFSVNWGIEDDRDVDSIEVTIEHDGDEFFESDEEEDSEYVDWDEHGEGEYTAELVVIRNGRECTRSISFDVDDDSGDSGDDDGRLRVQVDVDGGDADPDDFRIRVYDDDDAFVDSLRDNDRVLLSPGEYILRIDDGPDDDYVLDFVTGDCDEVDDFEAEVDIDEDESVICEFNMEFVGDTDPDPSDCEIVTGEGMIACYDGDIITEGDQLSLGDGGHITIAWCATGEYSSSSLQVYNETRGVDVYSSNAACDDAEVALSQIGTGDIQLRHQIYGPSRLNRFDFRIVN